ncbi:MAG: hypothetical protein Q4D26_04250 [Clostridia bacterium]|nr:hypothetical protein [Clostridia bacterium]
MFVNNELTADVWQKELEPILREYKILNFTKVLTKMCCKYIGLPFEKCIWCKDADDKACDEFIKNILEDGNFARKNKFVSLFACTYIPGRFIKRLFTGERSFKELITIMGSAKKRYPIIKKLKIFRE